MGSIPAYSTLIFTVELLKVNKSKPEVSNVKTETPAVKPAKKGAKPAAKKRR